MPSSTYPYHHHYCSRWLVPDSKALKQAVGPAPPNDFSIGVVSFQQQDTMTNNPATWAQVPKDFPVCAHHMWPPRWQRSGRPMVIRGQQQRWRDRAKLHNLQSLWWAPNCCNIANQDIRCNVQWCLPPNWQVSSCVQVRWHQIRHMQTWHWPLTVIPRIIVNKCGVAHHARNLITIVPPAHENCILRCVLAKPILCLLEVANKLEPVLVMRCEHDTGWGVGHGHHPSAVHNEKR